MDQAIDYRKELTDTEHKRELLYLITTHVATSVVEISMAEQKASTGCCDSAHHPELQHKRLIYSFMSSLVQIQLAERYCNSAGPAKIFKMLVSDEIAMMVERITQTLLEQLDEEVRAEAPKF
jgi:hypothetical protein